MFPYLKFLKNNELIIPNLQDIPKSLSDRIASAFRKSTTTDACDDVNGDDVVNVLDVIQTVNMALGSQDPDYMNADVNSDGIINVLDVITLVNCIVSEVDECDLCFDMNEDQVINIIDIVALVNLIVDN